MNKKFIITIVALLSLLATSAQTLFTYGKYAVDAKEFLRAYNKNNLQPVVNKGKSVSDYLELFINSRLKIREAYDRKYDTLPQIKSEVETLRAQIIENYVNDPKVINHLQKEAFERSQKDIHVAHIFISFRNAGGVMDTTAARLKKDELLQRLKKGEDFLQVALQLSDDPTIKTTKGELGYITVFTLPYEFENAIYTTPVGKYSSIVISKTGYHLFKNISERKAIGKIKAQQILLATPPGADEITKKKLAMLADSLYNRITAGDNFNQLATNFSSDYISAATGGTMADIRVGQYDPVFEKALLALPKDGSVSKPFLTAHGWHILKRTSVIPVVTDISNKSNLQELQAKIIADSRSRSSGDFINKLVREKAPLKIYPYNDAAMREMTDSILDQKTMTEAGRKITFTTPLFSIGDAVYTTSTWLTYAIAHHQKEDHSGVKPYEEVKKEFLDFALYNYYRDNLEDFNEEFHNQMMEFKDGNLFFEIMQQEIWNKAQTDSTALIELYEKNKKSYTWNQCADAVLFFCSDEPTAKKVNEEVKKNPADWRKVVDLYSEKVVADSSRYEWSQIPDLLKMTPKPGMITSTLINPNDNTASFAYIIKTYPEPMQRTFNESKGLLISDYQAILEKQWNVELKKKYPVIIDQKVLNDISK